MTDALYNFCFRQSLRIWYVDIILILSVVGAYTAGTAKASLLEGMFITLGAAMFIHAVKFLQAYYYVRKYLRERGADLSEFQNLSDSEKAEMWDRVPLF